MLIITFTAILVCVMAGCKETASIVNDENVTLSFATMDTSSPEFQDQLIKTFPNITFQFISLQNNPLEQLVNDQKTPDIILDVDRISIPPHLLDKVQYDMTPLIKGENMDLSRFDKGLIDHIQAYGDNGQVYALPYIRAGYVLAFNKKIFDTLNVPYPTDGMSWNEVIDLTKKLSVTKDGISYRGLDPSKLGFLMLMDEFGLNMVDPASDNAIATSDKWSKMAGLFRSIYDVPNNRPSGGYNAINEFSIGKLAMILDNGLDLLSLGRNNGQNIDLVSFPTIEKGSKLGPGSRTVNLMITKDSKHKNSAFQVISYLVSDKKQMENSKNGLASSLSSLDILTSFGSALPETSGKNVKAFFENKLPQISRISKYEGVAYQLTPNLVIDLAKGKEDTSNLLYNFNSSINKAVFTEKSKFDLTKQ